MAVPFRKEVSIMNQNSLFVLLNIPNDGTYNINKVEDNGSIKYIDISRPASPTFCPYCGEIMHSRGLTTRTVNHPIMQDGSSIILKVHQRRWRCTGCNFEENESYPFLPKYSRSSSITPFLVLEALKDLNRSAVSVAEQFNISDSTVHNIFSQYVDLKRLPLPEYISIDEVYMNISSNELYAFVIMDFITGEIVDIVHNRWASTLDYYFSSIDRAERENIKDVISDAYDPYQKLCERFFPNAVQILDSFHVVKFINNRINQYINDRLKKERKKQQEKLDYKNYTTNSEYRSIKDSKEIILLRDYRWVLLKDQDSINYGYERYYHSKLGMNVDTYQIETMFLSLDKNFSTIRNLKEMYIRFNNSQYRNSDEIKIELDKIISTYKNCELEMFRDFALFLERFKDSIIRSFTTIVCVRKSKKDLESHYSRLSNGPMEGFNRKPKDYKRNSRGFSNFDYTRNRILWATRRNPPILALPKSLKLVHSYHRKKK